ncbi:MAG: hypothetical protein WDA20_07570 [Desulfuromonadales bacterium]
MTNEPRKSAANRWPLLLFVLAGFFLALSSWSVYRAAHDVSAPVGAYPPAADAAALPQAG